MFLGICIEYPDKVFWFFKDSNSKEFFSSSKPTYKPKNTSYVNTTQKYSSSIEIDDIEEDIAEYNDPPRLESYDDTDGMIKQLEYLVDKFNEQLDMIEYMDSEYPEISKKFSLNACKKKTEKNLKEVEKILDKAEEQLERINSIDKDMLDDEELMEFMELEIEIVSNIRETLLDFDGFIYEIKHNMKVFDDYEKEQEEKSQIENNDEHTQQNK